MHEIVIGDYNGEPLIYETSEANATVLAMLTKLLVTTFVTFGLKALCKLVSSKEFKIKYPGGNLKLIYKLLQHATDDPNNTKCDLSVSVDNLIFN